MAGPDPEHPRSAERAVAAQLLLAERAQLDIPADELSDPAGTRRLARRDSGGGHGRRGAAVSAWPTTAASRKASAPTCSGRRRPDTTIGDTLNTRATWRPDSRLKES
ncbi:hypothetical protein ACIOD2_00225 [Amycolatopsis sp. NPDC088138]|uniref:hypothetical protein n=1 Tax=Amycolatopsis sp. NPDC088138 TaxID=3363938 RepID=UPI00382C1870